MKSNTTFIFAGIMSVIVGNAYATGENIVTSKSYVDNALEQKQNKIEAYDENNDEYQSVLTDTTTDGVVGKVQILNSDINNGEAIDGWENWEIIPTAGAVFQVAQGKIAASAWEDVNNNTIPGVVISTDENGVVEQRMILDKTLQIQDDSISALLTGDDRGVIEDIQSYYVFPDDISNAVPTTTMTVAIANAAAATKADHMTCAGWPDSVAVADRTDANCWLWNKN